MKKNRRCSPTCPVLKSPCKEDIKRLLAVYYEQNVTTEKFEDFDGERWIIPED